MTKISLGPFKGLYLNQIRKVDGKVKENLRDWWGWFHRFQSHQNILYPELESIVMVDINENGRAELIYDVRSINVYVSDKKNDMNKS